VHFVESQSTVLLAAGVFFVATLVRSALGFGEALIAVPLLALWMPVEEAVPAAVLVSITIAFVILLRDWRHVQFRSAAPLIFFSLLGTPLGLWFLRVVPEAWGKGVLGAVIIAFALRPFVEQRKRSLSDDKLAWIFGVQAGILGGAYGMNGPPLAIYGAMRGWSPGQFRATLQAYFLPVSTAGMAGYALTGLWTRAVTRVYVSSLPAVVLAIVAGSWLHSRIDIQKFPRYVYMTLLFIGVVLLWQALTAGI
jgi:uncharacterized membrane protein YfcA